MKLLWPISFYFVNTGFLIPEKNLEKASLSYYYWHWCNVVGQVFREKRCSECNVTNYRERERDRDREREEREREVLGIVLLLSWGRSAVYFQLKRKWGQVDWFWYIGHAVQLVTFVLIVDFLTVSCWAGCQRQACCFIKSPDRGPGHPIQWQRWLISAQKMDSDDPYQRLAILNCLSQWGGREIW